MAQRSTPRPPAPPTCVRIPVRETMGVGLRCKGVQQQHAHLARLEALRYEALNIPACPGVCVMHGWEW